MNGDSGNWRLEWKIGNSNTPSPLPAMSMSAATLDPSDVETQIEPDLDASEVDVEDEDEEIEEEEEEAEAGATAEQEPAQKKKRGWPEGMRRRAPGDVRHPPAGGLLVPLSRLKAIAKMDPDVKMIQQDAAVMLARATELFIHKLAADAADVSRRQRRKGIRTADLVTAISEYEPFHFLSEFNFVSGEPLRYQDDDVDLDLEADGAGEGSDAAAESDTMEIDGIVGGKPAEPESGSDDDSDGIVLRPSKSKGMAGAGTGTGSDSDSDSYANSLPPEACGMDSD